MFSTLGGDDIVEVDVPDRKHVDSEREKVEARDKQEGDNEDKQRTLKHETSWMACGWNECAPKTP